MLGMKGNTMKKYRIPVVVEYHDALNFEAESPEQAKQALDCKDYVTV